MPAGKEIYNPDFNLVISSDGRGFGYAGNATLVTSGAKTQFHYTTSPFDFYYGDITPFVFEYTSTSSVIPPLFAPQLTSDRVIDIRRIYLHSGTTWRCEILCFGAMSANVWQFVQLGAAPTVKVFTPYGSADDVPPWVMYDAAGAVCFSLARKPAWLRRRVNFAAVASTISPTFYPDGQSTGWSALTAPVPINCGGGGYILRFNDIGEDVFSGGYGYTLGSGVVTRAPYVNRQEPRPPDDPTGTTEYSLTAASLFIAEGSAL